MESKKSCPFCNAEEDYLDVIFQPPITVVLAYVKCSKCGARGGEARHNCLIETTDTLESKAIEFWNKRANGE
jgi:Lar family restriction alleviation protein